MASKAIVFRFLSEVGVKEEVDVGRFQNLVKSVARMYASATCPMDDTEQDLWVKLLVTVKGSGFVKHAARPACYLRRALVNFAIDMRRRDAGEGRAPDLPSLDFATLEEMVNFEELITEECIAIGFMRNTPLPEQQATASELLDLIETWCADNKDDHLRRVIREIFHPSDATEAHFQRKASATAANSGLLKTRKTIPPITVAEAMGMKKDAWYHRSMKLRDHLRQAGYAF